MSVQEIKDQIAALPHDAQSEVLAFLFHLRQAGDLDYQGGIAKRLDDKTKAHWLSPDEFERELDRREKL